MKKSQKIFLTILLCIATVTALSLTAFAETTTLPPNTFSPGGETKLPHLYNLPITMLKENGGLLFTALFIGIVLGIGGTLLVQHIRRKKK